MVPAFKMSNRRADMELQAGSIAQSSLEKLRVTPFDKVISSASDDVTIDGTVYQVAVTAVTEVEGGVPSQVLAKRVTVRVTWQWGDKEHTAFRETILTRVPRA